MFKLRRRAKPETKIAQPTRLGQAVDASPSTYQFVAIFDAAASNNRANGGDSGVYSMGPEDRFAVLREPAGVTADATAQTRVTSQKVPKIIAVMLEPDGSSRFFHPEASRRAGRPIWQPLQPLES